MSFEPKPSTRKTTSLVSDSGDLRDKCFAVGGGDDYIPELIKAARMEGCKMNDPRATPVSREESTFRPPGFESAE
jgi:hypothetical protein